MRRVCTLLGLMAAMALLVSGASFAQTLGSIQGYVNGTNNETLPGVLVVVRNQDTGAERTATTDASGLYRAQGLVAGPYSITASLDGMQTIRQENVRLALGQVLDVKLKMEVESTSEVITVTSEAPLIEISRSSAAAYVSELEIESLPIAGRDFKSFAFLTPTVQDDPVRGFVTMSGQRGIYSGMHVDGTDGKSAFFAYGRGGEASENQGIVIAQDSVQEFQVITNGFAPEYGSNGGGYINVITKSGTNNLQGSAFYQYRDQSFVEDIPSSPLDGFRGIDGSAKQSDFEDKNYGLSIGGPIVKDRTHFFFAYDERERTAPFVDTLSTRGAYDAILLRAQTDPNFLALVDGYTPNNDGVAAADPINGRTASGLFNRSVENTVLFGKLDHQFNDANTFSVRLNYTDFLLSSTFQDEESLKPEKTDSIILQLVSAIGSRGVNEARIQYATDDFDRLSKRVGQPIEAEVRFTTGGRAADSWRQFDSVGKFDFLPILVEEIKTQLQDNFSYLFGAHDLKFGIDYQEDDLKQLFAGSLDGRYDFDSVSSFLNNTATQVRIYFGNVSFPNYDETQTVLGLYGQDSLKVNENLTLNFGVRYQATDNPSGLVHLFPEGTSIPDDKDNIDPRVGFAWNLGRDSGPTQVLRGGIGKFTSRTPTLLFASQVQENGLFPNFGRVTVRPGQAGFVPLGTSIDNTNPPLTTRPSTSYVDPSFEDPETIRVNLGYERQIAGDWSAGVDAVYADGSNLQSNVDLNRTIASRDAFGRPVYSSTPVFSNLDTIFVRQSIGDSKYEALTLKVNKRFSGKYQFQAHYTWSEDKDSDSNERSATSVTVTDQSNPSYDYGLSDRNVENRLVASGVVILPLGFKLSGVMEYRDGTPYTALDALRPHNYPANNGPAARAVLNGELVGRNTFTNESLQRVDLRIAKDFDISRYGIEIYGQVFNLFNENSFSVGSSQATPIDRNGVANPEFGIAGNLATQPRTFEVGLRFSFK